MMHPVVILLFLPFCNFVVDEMYCTKII